VWGSKIEGPVSWIEAVRNLAETAKGLAKAGTTTPGVALVQAEDSEKVVQLPSYLGSARRLSSAQSPRENIPALFLIDTSLNEDLADSESSGQEIRQGSVPLSTQGDSEDSVQRGFRLAFIGSHELKFDLDPW